MTSNWPKSRPVPEWLRKENEEELHKMVYDHEDELRIEQFQTYHFRIFANNGAVIDVWPVRKRFYGKGIEGSRPYYWTDELLKFLKII